MAGRDMVPGERCVAGFTGMVAAGDKLVVFEGRVFPLVDLERPAGANGAFVRQAPGAFANGRPPGMYGELVLTILRLMVQQPEPVNTADIQRLMGLPPKHEKRQAVQQAVYRLVRQERLVACREDQGKARPRYVLTKSGRAEAERHSTPAG